MATTETRPTAPQTPEGSNVMGAARTEAPEFPGCKPVHLPRAEIERFGGRLEYWDAATRQDSVHGCRKPARR